MRRIDRIIKELEELLTAECTQFDILDSNGDLVEEEIEILNSKINAIIWLTAKGWDYKFQKFERFVPLGEANAYHAEICRVEIFVPNKESEFIFVYANLKNTDENTIKIIGWEISQNEFCGKNIKGQKDGN